MKQMRPRLYAMNAPRSSVNMKTPDCGFAIIQPVLLKTELSGDVRGRSRRGWALRRHGIGIGRIFVYAVAAALCGAHPQASHAAPDELSADFGKGSAKTERARQSGPRRPPEGGKPEAAAEEDVNDAKLFAARLKHQQGRHFAKRKRQFNKQQLQLESRRRALIQKKARMKARQFAAARRRAAEQAAKHNRRRGEERDSGGKRVSPGGKRG